MIENLIKKGGEFCLLAICLDGTSLAALQSALASFATPEFLGNFSHYLGQRDDLALAQRLQEWAPDICIVDFDQNREQASRTAEQLHDVLQGRTAIFAVSSQSEPDLIIAAMRAGCTEYLLKPLADDKLKEALQKIASKRREKEKTQKRGKVLTLLGAKGGSGVTTVATHLASFLPKIRSCKTLLIDHHSDLGDVSVYLGLDKHLYHFYELVNNVHRLDSELLAGFVLRHSSGLEVLASPDSLNTVNPTEGVSEQHMEQTIEFLRSVYDVIIIDCAPGFTGLNIAAIQPADEVCLIANPEIPAIRNLSRYLSHLARFSAPAERVRVVINRYSRKGPITEDQIEKVLQRPVSRTIPNNYAEVIQAINTGKPIIPLKSSEFVRAIQDWAETLAPDSMEAFAKEEPRKRFGLLRF